MCIRDRNQRTLVFNEVLEMGLQERESDDLNLFRLNLEEVFAVILENPTEFAFSNVTGQGINASDATGFLFWDEIHPSTAAHGLLAEAAFRQVQSIPAFGGDFDFDGQLDAADIDLLSRQIVGDTGRLSFDVDEDGVLSSDDVDSLLSMASRLNGDADFDGEVAFADFLIVSANFGQSDDQLRWSTGDFDSDGAVAFRDFLIVSRNFGQSSILVPVPEPTCSLLVAFGFCAVLSTRVRRIKVAYLDKVA